LAVLVSGDTAGWIVPCGCTSNQSGGLPRRASCTAQFRQRADILAADVGGAACGTSPYDRLKFEAILRGEAALGVAAHNVGASEAALGPEYLRDVIRRLHAPLVSANVLAPDGRAICPPAAVCRAGGRTVALVGVLGEQYASEAIQVLPPRQAVLDALAAIRPPCDYVVVLAYMPEDPLRQLAAGLPEADLIVGGPTGQPMIPEAIGPTLVASATNKGKFLACFEARGDGRHWQGRIVELSGRYADDPAQLANLRQFYADLARADFTPEQTGLASPPPSALGAGYRLAGEPSCRECHTDDCRAWHASKHAQAWESLRKKGAQVDPYCQQCHSTGYGLPGGFVSPRRTPKLGGVGCQSCHGPSQAHAEDPEGIKTPLRPAADRCRGCHDAENSPQFVYDEYWSKIRHGKESRPAGKEAPHPAGATEQGQ